MFKMDDVVMILEDVVPATTRSGYFGMLGIVKDAGVTWVCVDSGRSPDLSYESWYWRPDDLELLERPR